MLYRVKIGLQLKATRKDKKMSQSEAADCLGIDRSLVSKIETGRYTGSLKIYERYLASMGYVLAIETETPQQVDFDTLNEMFKDD
ncbi:MAG: helix-turn-helix transcriptional regulator [Gammaproteobacteria bacterium]|jgi:Helix-turn-helix.